MIVTSCLECKSMKNNHVKTNLIHKIHHIRSFKTLKLHEFKTLLTHDDYARCEKKCVGNTWYPLTLDIFARFIYKVKKNLLDVCCISYLLYFMTRVFQHWQLIWLQHDVVLVSEEASCKYKERILVDKWSPISELEVMNNT